MSISSPRSQATESGESWEMWVWATAGVVERREMFMLKPSIFISGRWEMGVGRWGRKKSYKVTELHGYNGGRGIPPHPTLSPGERADQREIKIRITSKIKRERGD